LRLDPRASLKQSMANYDDDVLDEISTLLERVGELESERTGAQRDLDNLTREVLGLRSEVQALRANLKTLRTMVHPLLEGQSPPVPQEPEVHSMQTFRIERGDLPDSVELAKLELMEGEETGRRPTPVPPMENALTPVRPSVVPVRPPRVPDEEKTGAFDIDATSIHIKMEDGEEDPTETASALQRLDPPTMDTGDFEVEETADGVIETTGEHDASPAAELSTDEVRGRSDSWVEDPTKVNIELPELERKGDA